MSILQSTMARCHDIKSNAFQAETPGDNSATVRRRKSRRHSRRQLRGPLYQRLTVEASEVGLSYLVGWSEGCAALRLLAASLDFRSQSSSNAER